MINGFNSNLSFFSGLTAQEELVKNPQKNSLDEENRIDCPSSKKLKSSSESLKLESKQESKEDKKSISTEEQSIAIARKILKTPGFIPGTEESSFSKLGEREHIQGNLASRQAAARLGIPSPEALSPSILRLVKEENLNFYFILQAKRLGYAFSLSGEFSLPQSDCINKFEGFSEAFTIGMIASSYADFAKQKKFQSDRYLEDAEKYLRHTYSSDQFEDEIYEYDSIAKKIQEGSFEDPICIASGYDWHATFVIFWGRYLLDCNRGSLCDGNPGIFVFHLPNLKLINSIAVRNLIKRHDLTEEKCMTREKMANQLGGRFIFYQPMKDQHKGNCTYVNVKAGLFTLLAIQSIRNQLSLDKQKWMDAKDWENSFRSVLPIYKEWSSFDGRLVFNEFKRDLEEIIQNIEQLFITEKIMNESALSTHSPKSRCLTFIIFFLLNFFLLILRNLKNYQKEFSHLIQKINL